MRVPALSSGRAGPSSTADSAGRGAKSSPARSSVFGRGLSGAVRAK
jgi:hypothetical protein